MTPPAPTVARFGDPAVSVRQTSKRSDSPDRSSVPRHSGRTMKRDFQQGRPAVDKNTRDKGPEWPVACLRDQIERRPGSARRSGVADPPAPDNGPSKCPRHGRALCGTPVRSREVKGQPGLGRSLSSVHRPEPALRLPSRPESNFHLSAF